MLSNPRKIFLIDGIGALLTATLLYALIRTHTDWFGVLPSACVQLAAVAFVFSVYSFSCYFLARGKWRIFLKIIATANILYCITTIVMLTGFHERLTGLAYVYFSLECGIITGLSIAEYRLASRL
jgi:hypothetical protein